VGTTVVIDVVVFSRRLLTKIKREYFSAGVAWRVGCLLTASAKKSDVRFFSMFVLFCFVLFFSTTTEAVLFPFVKEIRFGRSEIDDLGTAVPVVLQLNAFPTVVGIRDAGIAADDAPSLVAAVIAFVADVDHLVGIHEGVAHAAESVAWK